MRPTESFAAESDPLLRKNPSPVPPVERRDVFDDSPLIIAAAAGKIDDVRALLARGAQVDGRGEDNRSALLSAAEFGRIDVCRLLIEAGAVVDSKDCYGRTPLWMAASFPTVPTEFSDERMSYEICKLLLTRGADPNSTTLNRVTALMRACWRGVLPIARLLVEAGAELNARDHDGMTALFYAAKSGSGDICKYLLSKGAEYAVSDNKGSTPKQIAKANAAEAIRSFEESEDLRRALNLSLRRAVKKSTSAAL